MATGEATDRETIKRRGASWYSRAKTAEAGEIGGLVHECRDVPLRESFRGDLPGALRHFFPVAFPLPFSADHMRCIELLQKVATEGGQFAIAMPRGFGKTTIAIRAAIWAVLYGHRRSCVLVAASSPMALKLLRSIKDELRYNQRLADLFPEACVPIRCLEGKPIRAASQTVNGVPTSIVWKADELVMPSVLGSVSSGARFGVAGITSGNIRGQQHTTVDGAVVRPDIVIADDPQDRESARSVTQTNERLDILNGDVLGMAGPTQKLSCIVPCTVIHQGDLADQLLDRTKNPQWQGVRTKMLYSMPTHEQHWETYRDMRARGLREQKPAEYWNSYLRTNWDEMHVGAVPAWPERMKPDEISPVQSAMNWYYDSPAAFAAEAQNDPLKSATDTIEQLTALEVADKASGIQRGVVPGESTALTAFVDVQGKALFWLVAAFSPDFTGHVVDYGTFPDQKRMVFTLADIKRTASQAFPGMSQEAVIYESLELLSGDLLGRVWVCQDGTQRRIDKLGVDSGWQTDTVYRWSRESVHSRAIQVAKGRGIGAKAVPMSDYQPRKGEKIGHYWLTKTVGKAVPTRIVESDTNYWKTQAYRRLKMSRGDTGTVTLFGRTSDHPTLSAHFCSEFPVERSESGRQVWEWHLRSERPDNHWWDCLVGCFVLGSMLGCSMNTSQSRAYSQAKPRRTMTLAEMAGRANR